MPRRTVCRIPAAGKVVLEFDAPKEPVDVIARLPLPEARTIRSLVIDGQTSDAPPVRFVKLEKVRAPTRVEIQF